MFFSALIPCTHCLPSTPCYEAIRMWRCHRAHELRALCTFRWGMAPKRKRKRFIYIKFLSILSETLQYRRVYVSVARPCVEHFFNKNVCFSEEKNRPGYWNRRKYMFFRLRAWRTLCQFQMSVRDANLGWNCSPSKPHC